MRSLINEVLDSRGAFGRVIVLYGAKSPAERMFADELEQWKARSDVEYLETVDQPDDSWKGNVGVVTTIVDMVNFVLKTSIGVVCGPPIMMKFATFRLIEIGYPEEAIYLSMEKNMSCGIGKCGHCMLGEYMVCKDGPVLTYDLVKDKPALWD